MMLTLGMFVFMRQTLPFQTLQRDAEYRWPSNPASASGMLISF